jgi:hypothetical protein
MSEYKDITRIGVKKFDGNDFRTWKIRVESALMADDCWKACNTTFNIAEAGKVAENEKLNSRAKLIIISTISDNVLRSVYKETAKEMWAALCTKYEMKDIQGINFTRRNFFNCRQDKAESGPVLSRECLVCEMSWKPQIRKSKILIQS